MFKQFDEIERYLEIMKPENSVLYRRVFSGDGNLQRHLERYIKRDEDFIVVFKFEEHYPDIETVYTTLYDFQQLQKLLTEPNLGEPTRIIRILDRDWFFEALTVVSTLVGIVGAIYSYLGYKNPQKSDRYNQVLNNKNVKEVVETLIEEKKLFGLEIYKRQKTWKLQIKR